MREIRLTHLIAKASTTGDVRDVLIEASVLALVNAGELSMADVHYITPTIESCIRGTDSPSQAFKNLNLQLEYFVDEGARGTKVLAQVTFWLHSAIESARCYNERKPNMINSTTEPATSIETLAAEIVECWTSQAGAGHVMTVGTEDDMGVSVDVDIAIEELAFSAGPDADDARIEILHLIRDGFAAWNADQSKAETK